MPGHIVRLLCGLNDHYCFFLKTHIEVIDKIREGHHGFFITINVSAHVQCTLNHVYNKMGIKSRLAVFLKKKNPYFTQYSL